MGHVSHSNSWLFYVEIIAFELKLGTACVV